jgi:hypothetical protein
MKILLQCTLLSDPHGTSPGSSTRHEEDFPAWFPHKRGMFTVKSAYRLALNRVMMQQDRGATSVRPDGEQPSWKLIWQCLVPPKVRTLGWKICRNALATQLNLRRRGMVACGLCRVCGQEDEDTFHVFMRCRTRPLACNVRSMGATAGLPTEAHWTRLAHSSATSHPFKSASDDTYDNLEDLACT